MVSRILDKYEQQFSGSTNTEQFEVLKGLPFYHWESGTINCANQAQTDSYRDQKRPVIGRYQSTGTDFNHAIGLPRNDGVAYPLFDYERLLFDTLQNNKHVWIKKATGRYRVHAQIYGMVVLPRKERLFLFWLTDVHHNRAPVLS